MSDTAGIGTFLAAMAGLGIIFAIAFVVLWVLKSIGLAQMARNKGIENEWLAWLPVADLYIMGTLVEKIELQNFKVENLGLWFPVASLLGLLLSGVPFLGVIVYLALLVFQIVFIYHFFKMYTSQAPLYTILCVFFAFLFPIFIFSLRNNSIIEIQADDSSAETASATTPAPNEDMAFADNLNKDFGNSADGEEEAIDIPEEGSEPKKL